MSWRAGVALAVLVATLAAAGPAAGADEDGAAARLGLARAVAAGRLSAASAARYRSILSRALSTASRLSGARAANLGFVLHEVAAQARLYDEPRALTLFSMLDVNARYLGARDAPAARTDILGPDLVVYRFFPGKGFQFHPLADFGALNADLAAGRGDQAQRLAAALLARAVPGNGTLLWEYWFPFAGGRPPWVSGMAQAVAAQALARASTLPGASALLDAATRAYRVVPGLLLQLDAGQWVRLYSFDDAVVLNAQLQAVLSVEDYAAIAADADATALGAQLQEAAAALLPRFDTGFWSLYSLAGDESPLQYHQYVVSLLQKLAARVPAQTVWADTAARFQQELTEPPAFALGAPAAPLAPTGGAATISFWLSKRSTVTLDVGGDRRSLVLGEGWHNLSWSPADRGPGVYAVRLSAVDLAGNQGGVQPLPVAVLAQ